MRPSAAVLPSGLVAALVTATFLFPQAGNSEETETKTPLEQGKALAVEYCQACHYFEGTDQAGTVGPPLLAMKPRFPERGKLESLIYDPQGATNPNSMMPPFGRNGLLDDKEIELILDFLYTL